MVRQPIFALDAVMNQLTMMLRLPLSTDDVRSDKSDTTWLQLAFESDKSNKLVLAATGSSTEAALFDDVRPTRCDNLT